MEYEASAIVKRRPFAAGALAVLAASSFSFGCASTTYCGESPVYHRMSLSTGSTSGGALLGGVRFADTAAARVIPGQKARCLDWGTGRLVAAIGRAGEAVALSMPGTPSLGVGNLSRAAGGRIHFSRSHQSGRDVDLAFYLTDAAGRPIALHGFARVGPDLRGAGGTRFDVARNWLLVRSLLTDPEIEVVWIFVSQPLRAALLEEAKRRREEESLQQRAAVALHQPGDAPPHDDHFHLRIACTAEEREFDCR